GRSNRCSPPVPTSRPMPHRLGIPIPPSHGLPCDVPCDTFVVVTQNSPTPTRRSSSPLAAGLSPLPTGHAVPPRSSSAARHEDGSQVEPPISTCEEQAFVYVAKLHMSEMLWFMGDRDLARRMFHDASELKKRFNDRFWMPKEEFFALGLDAKRRQIRSITSNP